MIWFLRQEVWGEGQINDDGLPGEDEYTDTSFAFLTIRYDDSHDTMHPFSRLGAASIGYKSYTSPSTDDEGVYGAATKTGRSSKAVSERLKLFQWLTINYLGAYRTPVVSHEISGCTASQRNETSKTFASVPDRCTSDPMNLSREVACRRSKEGRSAT